MTPGNYVVHAEKDLLGQASNVSGAMAEGIHGFVSESMSATKFVLPFDGRALGRDKSAFPDVFRLPFEQVVLEMNTGMGPTFCLANNFKDSPDVIDLYFANKTEDGWWGMGFACYRFAKAPDDRFDAEIRLLVDPTEQGLEDAKLVGTNLQFALFEFMLALECCNVETEIVPASPKLNAKRISNGRRPFFDYHVLTLPGSTGSGASLGGTHASPRMHLRRGHVRRLDDGRKTWVNSHVVGKIREGLVTKDYRIAGGEQ